MAKLKNLERIWTLDWVVQETVRVGNNRIIKRKAENRFTGHLHGWPVFNIVYLADGRASVCLQTCGYLTATTIAAMSDFSKAFGLKVAASRAGGVLSARWECCGGEWHECNSRDGEQINFIAERYPSEQVEAAQ